MTNEPTDTSPPDLCAACERLRVAMQAAGLLERPAPPAAVRWIATFGAAYPELLERPEAALETVRALRAEAVTLRALDLERLRSRAVLFFLDAFGQWVDDQPELCGLDVEAALLARASEFGIAPDDARWAVRVALAGAASGPPLELLLPLLGHDRILIRIGAVSGKILHGRGLEPLAAGPDGKPFTPIGGAPP